MFFYNFEGDSLIIAATNHQHILDPAIWRRFDEIIYFDLPDYITRMKILELYLKPLKKEKLDLQPYAKKTNDFSPSDLKMMCVEAMKYAIVSERDRLTVEDIEYAFLRFKDRADIRKGGREKR